MLINHYEINEQTILLTGIYGRFSHLQTMIIEGDKTYHVNGSAGQIIDKALKKAGSSLRMEMASTREKLGNLKMYPIKINPHMGLYFFPSKSPKRPDCVWFSLIHVKGAKTFGKNKTKVYLSHGHSIILDCRLSAFNHKLRRAQELRRMTAKNGRYPLTFYLEPKQCFRKHMEITNDNQKDITRGQNDS